MLKNSYVAPQRPNFPKERWCQCVQVRTSRDGSGLDRTSSACNRGLMKGEDKMPSYDQSNIFAKILRGEIPCYKVYEDAKALAFLDIMPRAPGHTLVIPKGAARNILDVAPDDFAHVMTVAQRIAKISVNLFGADGVTLQQFSEPAGGQVVFHLHG